MQSGMAHSTPNLLVHLTRSQPFMLLPALSALHNQRKTRNFLQHFRYTTEVTSEGENKATVESLYELSVDIKKIRRLKPWVLCKEVTYAKETAKILQEMGADRSDIMYIFERCPEAILCRPTSISCQRDLWLSVCPNEKQLVELIKRFPETFFTVEHYEKQKGNIRLFKDVGLKNTIISRLLTSAPNIFNNPVEKNKHMLETLQSSYLRLGGSQENMKIWLLKLLCQDPFILLNSPVAVQENLQFLQKNDFTNLEIVSLLSRLKGFIFQLNTVTMQNSMLFSKSVFKCSVQELRQLIIKCPALLYHSVPVLEERLERLLKAGISVGQIKDTPAVLELTPEIVQYRIKKLDAIGYDIRRGNLENVTGTKKEFEATYGKIQAKRERPIFNPVAPLHIED
ncbi:PREDICTED: transcription termination factor 2, mitochondrial [Gekko japonicus]|uniref:Transcription termination factor 2, mitochondrial n=1 Tax=Gekko japonicus TaxID=146911 RepID=A0ABM1LAS4_GEKJA|nr:PREDICTED: transcription termination factor 2, mitochondrial [Gekko japonicus]XP_015283062.1 PREDICTED: transcription termination factor 2, mitochondrial [Gekko japonicus]